MPTYWEDLNWAEFQTRGPEEFAVAIMPIGTIESRVDEHPGIDQMAKIAHEFADFTLPSVSVA